MPTAMYFSTCPVVIWEIDVLAKYLNIVKNLLDCRGSGATNNRRTFAVANDRAGK
jgi:hypothetical protein